MFREEKRRSGPSLLLFCVRRSSAPKTGNIFGNGGKFVSLDSHYRTYYEEDLTCVGIGNVVPRRFGPGTDRSGPERDRLLLREGRPHHGVAECADGGGEPAEAGPEPRPAGEDRPLFQIPGRGEGHHRPETVRAVLDVHLDERAASVGHGAVRPFGVRFLAQLQLLLGHVREEQSLPRERRCDGRPADDRPRRGVFLQDAGGRRRRVEPLLQRGRKVRRRAARGDARNGPFEQYDLPKVGAQRAAAGRRVRTARSGSLRSGPGEDRCGEDRRAEGGLPRAGALPGRAARRVRMALRDA